MTLNRFWLRYIHDTEESTKLFTSQKRTRFSLQRLLAVAFADSSTHYPILLCRLASAANIFALVSAVGCLPVLVAICY